MVRPPELSTVCDGMMPARFWPRPSHDVGTFTFVVHDVGT